MTRIDRLVNLAHWLVWGAKIVMVNEFRPAPYGGGNQFLGALRKALISRGQSVGVNHRGWHTRVALFNSFNFDFERIRTFRDLGLRMVHRVDGPISAYRGRDRELDEKIWQINHDVADATVFQSEYSLSKHREMGLQFTCPVVIPNACDDTIFFPPPARRPLAGRRVRLITTSWSDNPMKGGDVYRWLDENLDFSRYEFTFLGRTKEVFRNIRVLPPVPSRPVADMLRQQDVFITASCNDCCSNALIEALACGLPAVYHDSGGSRELVGDAGYGFQAMEKVPALIERCVANLEQLREYIRVASIGDVADRYLEALCPT